MYPISQSITLHAPCKLNLSLRIKDRRPDGYHDLESIFVALTLGDTVEVTCTGAPGTCAIQTDWSALNEATPIPLEEQSIYQAAGRFRDRTGFDAGVCVQVTKRIPLGAGLGGGSSDAAAMLKALNILAGTPLGTGALLELAADLGSDVPFFIQGGAAAVSGRGERIRPLTLASGWQAVLVYPGFPSSTAQAFHRLDAFRASQPRSCWPACMEIGPIEQNDFLPMFLTTPDAEAAAYQTVLETLVQMGADQAGLSGSGSVCFGIFRDQTRAEEAAQILREKQVTHAVQVWITRPA